MRDSRGPSVDLGTVEFALIVAAAAFGLVQFADSAELRFLAVCSFFVGCLASQVFYVMYIFDLDKQTYDRRRRSRDVVGIHVCLCTTVGLLIVIAFLIIEAASVAVVALVIEVGLIGYFIFTLYKRRRSF